MTKYYRYNRSYDHNTEDCWALKDKIEELIQVGYLAQFVKRSNSHAMEARPGGHQEEHHRHHDVDKKRDKVEDRGRWRHHHQRRQQQPPQEQENEPTQQIKGVINTVADEFSYGRQSN